MVEKTTHPYAGKISDRALKKSDREYEKCKIAQQNRKEAKPEEIERDIKKLKKVFNYLNWLTIDS